MGLSERERRFVEAYMGEAAGNGTKAAILAGYSKKAARGQAARLLTKAHIIEAIQDRTVHDKSVADRQERQEFLSAVMRGENGYKDTPIRDRVKAADLLA